MILPKQLDVATTDEPEVGAILSWSYPHAPIPTRAAIRVSSPKDCWQITGRSNNYTWEQMQRYLPTQVIHVNAKLTWKEQK